ncbi:MAG TPA: DUF2501 domain-containing protein [Rudaea sp.]|jgi:hypothetical protein
MDPSSLASGSAGKSVDIGKLGSMKQSVTKKACASVLDHATSLHSPVRWWTFQSAVSIASSPAGSVVDAACSA